MASQRAGRVDSNPHQVDAVVFALARIPEGGCILADEVGLGKTIEAGLVIAQLMAEGANRVLLITPKALLGQWQQELTDLFGIDTVEATAGPESFSGSGVFLIGREQATSIRGEAALKDAAPFDLCVIDEAHEIFAGIHKRFDRLGQYDEESPHALMAGRLRAALDGTGTPVILLTATPIQNSLPELWGLVQYVDPTGTLLGDITTFRKMFCGDTDRILREGQENELRRRLNTVVKRTLRRQAQAFMEQPFVGRQAHKFEYSMSPEEKSLYDDVTDYLLRPALVAFRGNQRRLLLIGFHRRMASSHSALAASLRNVADRLQRTLDMGAFSTEQDAEVIKADLEDDDMPGTDTDTEPLPPPEVIQAELDLVESFIARADALTTDGKAQALIKAVRMVLKRGEEERGSGKVVVFTESLTTQEYIRDLLLESGVVGDQDVTLFRGTNDSPRATEALRNWQAEVADKMPTYRKPTREVATRLALVYEFKTRSKVFISTEAGAKGLNLQFCDTLVNYDLPWNPQRIEQRIGRCHRYGQKTDVTVINFVATDNEAQQLTLEILTEKLDLFGTVLGASDEVLHRPSEDAPESVVGALGSEFENRVNRIWERARSKEQIVAELRELRESMDTHRKRFDEAHKRTGDVIQSRFDDSVKQVFKQIELALPTELARFDREIDAVLKAYLEAAAIPHERIENGAGPVYRIAPTSALPGDLKDGLTVVAGPANETADADPLHVGHPLITAAVTHARGATDEAGNLVLDVSEQEHLRHLRGRSGRLWVVKARFEGFESVERLLPILILGDDPEPLELDVAQDVLLSKAVEVAPDAGAVVSHDPPSDEDMEDALDQIMFQVQTSVAEGERARFERIIEQIEQYIEDRLLLLGVRHEDIESRLRKAEAERDGAMGSERRSAAEEKVQRLGGELEQVDERIADLQARNDERYSQLRTRTHERRFTPPTTERLVDASVTIL